MKTLLRSTVLFLMLLSVGQLFAQATATDRLNDVISYAEDIDDLARHTRRALRTLVIDYFQQNNTNPNVAAYLAVMTSDMSDIEEAQDEIYWLIGSAAQLNSAIDPANIQNWASQIEAREDAVQNQSNALQSAIQSNNRQAARVAVRAIRAALAEMIVFSDQIIDEATNYLSIAQTYNVRIVLYETFSGNYIPYTSTGLQGFYAQDQSTQQYIYPDYYGNQDEFLNLSSGTYTFGAYDGYFDGAGSNTVTLDPSLVGSDGYITVELSYWSE